MAQRYATYRIGLKEHSPDSSTGAEITERTSLGAEDFTEETRAVLGPISLIWFGSVERPKISMFLKGNEK